VLFEVLLRQSYDAKNVLNRWHYSSAGVPAAVQLSFALASAFGGIPDPVTSAFPAGSIMDFLAQTQVEALAYVELQVEAMYDVSDFYTVPYAPGQTGGVDGTPMSSFAAYALQSNRVRTDIRRGNKRFCGVSESYVADAGVVIAPMTTTLASLSLAMTDPLVYDDEGTDLTFAPVILSFEKHDPDADHDDFWYAKYPTLAEQLDHAAIGITWTAKSFMTTQNTRKR